MEERKGYFKCHHCKKHFINHIDDIYKVGDSIHCFCLNCKRQVVSVLLRKGKQEWRIA